MNSMQTEAALQKIKQDIQNIRILFGDNGRIKQGQNETVKRLYKTLKNNLNQEDKRMSPIRVQEKFSPYESAFYHPAIAEILIAATLRTNSNYSDNKWIDCLNDMDSYVEYWLDQIHSVKKTG